MCWPPFELGKPEASRLTRHTLREKYSYNPKERRYTSRTEKDTKEKDGKQPVFLRGSLFDKNRKRWDVLIMSFAYWDNKRKEDPAKDINQLLSFAS